MSSTPEKPNLGSDPVGFSLHEDSRSDADIEKIVFERVIKICEDILGPNAQDTDRGLHPLEKNIQELARAGLMGIALPQKYGGVDLSNSARKRCSRLYAEFCGVTAFTQEQHHGSSRMIADGPNRTLADLLTPDLAAGKSFCAVSFAHLRRPGPSTIIAEKVNGGWVITGKAPWVTGWNMANQLVLGAALSETEFLYLWTPAKREDFLKLFDDKIPQHSGSYTSSPPLSLCAMNASSTVELNFDRWFIPEEHLLKEIDRDTMRHNDRLGVLGATALPLGCAAASLKLLKITAEKRHIEAADKTAEKLTDEYLELNEKIDRLESSSREAGFVEKAIKARAWCIEFAVRSAHAAVTAASGSANNLDHPAQRLYREAMFYTIQAQTREVLESTLTRLEPR